MAPKRWISTAVVTAAMAAAPHRAARAQVPATAPAAAEAPADAKALAAHDLAELNNRLIQPAGANPILIQQQRDEAAHRLLSRPSAQSVRDLQHVLETPNLPREAKLAVAKAIADDPHPDPVFANALLPLLGGERSLSDAGAKALARFSDNPVARDRLLAFAKNPAQPVNLRLGVIRALGAITTREVADDLVALATNPKQGLPIQNAAMDALIELSGQTENGHNVEKWKQWQAANAAKPAAAWHEDLLQAREARGVQEAKAQADMISELSQIIEEQYQQGNFAAKTAIIMRELNSPDPRVRLMGVGKVIAEQANALPIPPTAPRRLQEMVGDSEPSVRLKVAEAIKARNDIDALDAILTQLPQETVVEVKVALVDALVNMKRVRAVPELRALLRDPSLQVAGAAVRALSEMADTLLKQNPARAHEVAQELWQVGGQRANEPGGIEFQAATIEAAGLLHDRDLAKDLLGLLNLNNPERIRSAALRALASLGDRGTSFQIAQWLANEPSAAVRINAITALGSTSSFESAADTLYRYTSPNTETDASVRAQAWREFESLLPKANNIQVLTRWSDEFKNDPARRLEVLVALNDLLQRQMEWDSLAYSRQNTGETYMDPKINEPAKAAIQFEIALNYWQDKRTPTPVTAQLVQQLLQALLSAKDYDKAATFGSKQIARDPTQQTTIGPALKDAVNRLHDDGLRDNDAQKLKDGVKLADAVLKMQPPLAERFQNVVRQLEGEMQERLKKK